MRTVNKYIDDKDKWMYDTKGDTPYFAVYSLNDTTDDKNPTLLYASKGKTAEFENEWIMSEFIGDGNGDLQQVADSSVKLHEIIANANGNETVYYGDPVGRRSRVGNVALHSGNSRNRPSKALINCVENILKAQSDGTAGGTGRTGRAGLKYSKKSVNSEVTTANDAEYMELAKNPEENEARLREMVEDAESKYINTILLPNDDDEVGFKYHRGKAPTKTFKRYAVFNVSDDGFRAAYAGNKNANVHIEHKGRLHEQH